MASQSLLNRRYLDAVGAIKNGLEALGAEVNLPNHREPELRRVLWVEELARAVSSLASQPAPMPPVVSDQMTLEELRTFAVEHDIDLSGLTRKADILAKILEAMPTIEGLG